MNAAKQAYINLLIDSGALKVKNLDEEPFTLRNGKTSRLYVDTRHIAGDAAGRDILITALQERLNLDFKPDQFYLSYVNSATSPLLCGALAGKYSQSVILVKSDELTRAEQGVGEQVVGPDQLDKPVVIVDDVGNSGQTIITAAEAIRQRYPGATIHALLSLVKKPDEFSQAMAAQGIKTYWVTTLDEALLGAWNKLSDGQKAAVKAKRPAFL